MPFDPNQIKYVPQERMPIGPEGVQQPVSGFDPSQINAMPGDADRSPTDPFLGGVALDSVTTPEMFNTPNEKYPSASIGAVTKAYMVDDPYTKAKIFSESRGLPLSRYGIHEGQVVFLGDDGKIYYEEPPAEVDLISAAKSLIPPVAQGLMVGGSYAAAPATGGSSLLIPMAAAGGLEAARKTAGATIFDEPVDPFEITKDIALESVFALFSDLVTRGASKVFSKTINKARTPSARAEREAVDVAGESAYSPEIGNAYDVWKDASERYGIDLNMAQAAQSPQLASAYRLLRDLPETTSRAVERDLAQDLQIERAAFDLFKSLGRETDNAMAGARTVQVSNEYLNSAKAARSDAVRPLYQRAFKESDPVDIEDAVSILDNSISELPTGSTTQRALKRMRKLFFDGDKPVSQLQKVDYVKREIDAILNGSHPFSDQFVNSTKADLFRRMGSVRDSLVSAGDKASAGLYKEARDKFIELTPAVETARQGVLGQITKLRGDNVAKASKMLLSGESVTPESAKRTFNYIRSIDPEAADSAITSYLSTQLSTIKADQTGMVRNVGGKLYQKLFGTERQREILKSVLPGEKYGDLKDFMSVLRKTGITGGMESTTAARQEMLKIMGEGAKSMRIKTAEFALSPLEKSRSFLNDRLETALNAQYRERLFEAIQSGRFAKRIKQLKRMDPRTEKFARTAGITIGQMIATPAIRSGQTSGDINIPTGALIARPPER